MYEKFFKKAEEANEIAIFMHINPDGDCIGSALALYRFLSKLGKKCSVFLEPNNVIKDCFKIFPFIDKINETPIKKSYDLAVAVDCGSYNMLGKENYAVFEKSLEQFSIDHHEIGTPFTKEFIMEAKASSNTSILYKMFKEYNKSLIDTDIATLLFGGLITDSGALTYSTVTAESYLIAAELCSLGINIYQIIRKLFKETKKNAFSLANLALGRTEFYFDNTVGIIYFTKEDFLSTDTTKEDTSGIINRVVDIVDIKLAVGITELNNNVYQIGFRSKDNVNVGSLAKRFGGGGHFYASGCRLIGKLDEVKAKILEHIKESKCL